MRDKPGELARGFEEILGVDVLDVESRAACYVVAETVLRVHRAHAPRKMKK
jgi:hypothetical protein